MAKKAKKKEKKVSGIRSEFKKVRWPKKKEMFKYCTDLRSMTQSRGEYTCEFERYEEAPMEVQQAVIAARKKEA